MVLFNLITYLQSYIENENEKENVTYLIYQVRYITNFSSYLATNLNLFSQTGVSLIIPTLIILL